MWRFRGCDDGRHSRNAASQLHYGDVATATVRWQQWDVGYWTAAANDGSRRNDEPATDGDATDAPSADASQPNDAAAVADADADAATNAYVIDAYATADADAASKDADAAANAAANAATHDDPQQWQQLPPVCQQRWG